jgi:multidrug efflux pump subunit AcrB
VFVPMFLLSGVARYLFVPLAEAVVFAMLASYVLSARWCRRWRCICCGRSITRQERTRNPLVRFQRASSAASNAIRAGYRRCWWLVPRAMFIPVFLLCLPVGFLLVPWLGQDFFPQHRQRAVHSAHARQDRHPHRGDGAAGDLVEAAIRRVVPPRDGHIVDNIGCPTAPSTDPHVNRA